MANQISKEKLVEYLNKRIDVRDKHEYDVNSPFHYSNEAVLYTFKSILTLIEQGMFDDETEYVKEVNGALIDKRLYGDINYPL